VIKVFHSFKLDVANQRLFRGDTRILLAPKAFSVLRHLVEHAGRLVSQDELLEALWPGTFVQPEVLRKYILEIRKVLEDPPKHPQFIETLPKRGYQFIAPVRDEYVVATPVPDEGGAVQEKLVGRESASRELNRCLSAAFRGQRQIVFVTGEAGIGKTTLIDAFQRQATLDANVRLVRGQCVEGFGGKEAYYPVLEALGQFLQGSGNDRLVETLASQAPTWLIQFPAVVKPEQREALQRELLGATRQRMVREICEALETLTAQRALVLLLEDLQWVDDSTLDLISALARRRGPARLMILASYRPVEVILAQGPLKALKQDLLVHRLCTEVALERLSESQIEQYLEVEFPGCSFPKGLAGLIYQHSDGNPLFMVAVVEQLVKKGSISREQGGWAGSTALEQIDPGVPETLQEMLEFQLEQLSPAEQRILRAASVGGRRFSAWTILTALDMAPAQIEDTCDTLAGKQQVIRRGGVYQLPDGAVSAQYEFKHALYREVLYRQLPGPQKSQIHRKLAERLEELGGADKPSIASELALHFEAGHAYQRAVHYLIAASENAAGRYAHRESIKLLRHALELCPRGSASSPDQEVGILERISDAHYALGEMVQSAEADGKVAELAAQAGLKVVQVNALTRLARALAFMDPEGCIAVCERAVEVSKTHDDLLLQARVEMLAASWRIVTNGWRREDAQICAGAREKIRQLADADLPAYYEILYAHVQCVQGDYLGAFNTAESGIPRSVETHSLVVYLSALSSETLALFHLGWWGKLRKVLATAIEMAEKNGNDPWLGIFRSVLAWLYLHASDFAGARQLSEELLQTHSEEPAGQVRTIAMITAGFVELQAGKHDAARQYFAKVCNREVQPKFFLDWYWRKIARLGLAEVGLAQGKLSRAREDADLLLQSVLTGADPTLQAWAWDLKARIAMAGRNWSEAPGFVDNALDALQTFSVPVAAWKVHATASELHRHSRNAEASAHHRSRAAAILLELAESFDADDPLRATLLSSSTARRLLAAAAKPAFKA
jgi:DNA-binding winged helix-turn-helix (wHTH) protein